MATLKKFKELEAGIKSATSTLNDLCKEAAEVGMITKIDINVMSVIGSIHRYPRLSVETAITLSDIDEEE